MRHDRERRPTYRELLESRPPERIHTVDAIVWSHLEASWTGKRMVLLLAVLMLAAMAGAGWYAFETARG
jgi:hypothetical protein